jgi:hypothetical protein
MKEKGTKEIRCRFCNKIIEGKPYKTGPIFYCNNKCSIELVKERYPDSSLCKILKRCYPEHF